MVATPEAWEERGRGCEDCKEGLRPTAGSFDSALPMCAFYAHAREEKLRGLGRIYRGSQEGRDVIAHRMRCKILSDGHQVHCLESQNVS